MPKESARRLCPRCKHNVLNRAAMAADHFQVAAIGIGHHQIEILGQRSQVGHDRRAAGAYFAFPDQRTFAAALLACDRLGEHAHLRFMCRLFGGCPQSASMIVDGDVAKIWRNVPRISCGFRDVSATVTQPRLNLSCAVHLDGRHPVGHDSGEYSLVRMKHQTSPVKHIAQAGH